MTRLLLALFIFFTPWNAFAQVSLGPPCPFRTYKDKCSCEDVYGSSSINLNLGSCTEQCREDVWCRAPFCCDKVWRPTSEVQYRPRMIRARYGKPTADFCEDIRPITKYNPKNYVIARAWWMIYDTNKAGDCPLGYFNKNGKRCVRDPKSTERFGPPLAGCELAPPSFEEQEFRLQTEASSPVPPNLELDKLQIEPEKQEEEGEKYGLAGGVIFLIAIAMLLYKVEREFKQPWGGGFPFLALTPFIGKRIDARDSAIRTCNKFRSVLSGKIDTCSR